MAALDDERVVKAWDRRPRAEVDRLRTFYAAVATGLRDVGAPFAVPEVLESRRSVGSSSPCTRGSAAGARARRHRPEPVVEVLEWLARVEPHPDMAALPVPDGEAAFDPAVPFGWSMAALVERRAPLLGDAVAPGVVDRLAAALRALEPVPPRLVHGDLGPCTCSSRTGARPGCSTSATSPPWATRPSTPRSRRASRTCSPRRGGGDRGVRRAVGRPAGPRPGPARAAPGAYGLVTASCLADHPGRHLTWCLRPGRGVGRALSARRLSRRRRSAWCWRRCPSTPTTRRSGRR